MEFEVSRFWTEVLIACSPPLFQPPKYFSRSLKVAFARVYDSFPSLVTIVTDLGIIERAKKNNQDVPQGPQFLPSGTLFDVFNLSRHPVFGRD
jgi:hypothetical protein